MQDDRFIDPYDLPEELNPPIIKQNKETRISERSIDLYDLDLHDEFDWLAQPCVEVTPMQEWDGHWDEG